jgi:hypothetical protein
MATSHPMGCLRVITRDVTTKMAGTRDWRDAQPPHRLSEKTVWFRLAPTAD